MRQASPRRGGERHLLHRRRASFALVLAGTILGAVSTSRAQSCSTTLACVDSSGVQGNAASLEEWLSQDGRYVAFMSDATNLVPGDTNHNRDVFVHDRLTGQTERMSVSSSGTQGMGTCFYPCISADGRYVSFSSSSINLVAGDTNNKYDIFVHDRTTGQTVRASVGYQGGQSTSDSFGWLSADGRYVVFDSDDPSLVPGDTNGVRDVFVRDLQLNTTVRVSLDSNGMELNMGANAGAISADGRYVAFGSSSANLGVGTGTQGYVRDLVTGAVTQFSLSMTGGGANAACFTFTFSADGRYLAFASPATNLVPNDTNNTQDIFVRDLVAATTARINLGPLSAQATAYSANPMISLDGRCVVFLSLADHLDPNDSNGRADVLVRDLLTNTTKVASLAWDGTPSNADSVNNPSISGDGRVVAFYTNATNLVPSDTNPDNDVFVRECDLGSYGSFCDGTVLNCPCGNSGTPGHGCANSQDPNGAILTVSGAVNPDSIVLSASEMLPTATAIFLQGDANAAVGTPWGGVVFGDGNRCAGGHLKRLAVKMSVAGAAQFPQVGDPSITTKSAALGDAFGPGAIRYYQTYYRDPAPTFCGAPVGNTFNITNGITILW